jgi:hypothetical protein
MEVRRRSLQKRRIQRYAAFSMTNNGDLQHANFLIYSSDYISKASPLKISFTPSASECSTPSPEYHNDAPTPRTDQIEPPELARRHDSDTNEIYPSAGRDTLDSFLNIDSNAQPFFMTPLPPSPNRQRSVNSFNAVLDQAPGRHTGKPQFGFKYLMSTSAKLTDLFVRIAERRQRSGYEHIVVEE